MGGWTCPRLHGFVLWLFPHTPWPQALLTPLLPLGQCQAQVGLSPLQKPSCMVLDLPLDGVSFHPQVHESVFMVVQLLEVSRDTGCINWLVITRDKAESLQNAACSPDKNLSCSSLSGKSTQEDQAQPPQRGGTASGFHSCSIQSIAGPGATSSLSQFTSGPSPIHSRALRPPLTASPKMDSPAPALWGTGVTQKQKDADVPVWVSAGNAGLFNLGPEESDSCLSFLPFHPGPSLSLLVLLCPPGLQLSKSTCLAPVWPHKSALPAPLPSLQDMSQPASLTTAL